MLIPPLFEFLQQLSRLAGEKGRHPRHRSQGSPGLACAFSHLRLLSAFWSFVRSDDSENCRKASSAGCGTVILGRRGRVIVTGGGSMVSLTFWLCFVRADAPRISVTEVRKELFARCIDWDYTAHNNNDLNLVWLYRWLWLCGSRSLRALNTKFRWRISTG